jgi:hypothetical protein
MDGIDDLLDELQRQVNRGKPDTGLVNILLQLSPARATAILAG